MTARPQAFARVPRGRQTGTAKKPDLIRIDAVFLEKFERAKLSDDLSTIMTKTDSKMSVDINAQSSIGYTLRNPEGKIVADKADIKRIQTMSSSITKERKTALGEEVGTITKFTLAAMVQQGNEFAAVAPIQRFHKSFVGVYRTVNTQYQLIAKNVNAIESLQLEGTADEVKNTFVEMGRRISTAVGKYLYHRANLAEDATAEKLNAFLFREHVPISLFEKLSSAVIQTSAQGFDVRHLLFPKDPTKGVYLTFKEIRNEPFRNDTMGLLAGSQLLVRLALNDALIRAMINVPTTTALDNFDEANSVASKMANTPFFLIPMNGAVETTDVFNYLAKNGVRGVTWASGTVLTPPDLLKFYGTIAKRLFYGLLIRPMNKADLLRRMFEGFTFDNESEQRDVFAQLKTWSLLPGSNPSWFAKIRGPSYNPEARLLIKAVFDDVTMISPDHGISTQFAAVLRSDATAIRQGAVHTDPLIFTEVKNLSVTLRERRIDPEVILGDRISLAVGKKAKVPAANRAGTQERSRLTETAKTALSELRTRRYSALALRMQTWFRLFLDETIQEAVAAIFLARLESFLSTPIELSREDRQAFMEPTGPDVEEDEQEAPPADPQEEHDNADEE